MARWIKQIQIKGLHGWLDSNIDLLEGINVFYGRNGSGKTTLLHVIANILAADIKRFLFLQFDSITLTFSDGQRIRLSQEDRQGEKVRSRVIQCFVDSDHKPIVEISADLASDSSPVRETSGSGDTEKRLRKIIELRPIYFPAFRSILEATNREASLLERGDRFILQEFIRSSHRRSSIDEDATPQTRLCRELFGEFTPSISYPSLREVVTRVEGEISSAILQVAAANRQLYSRTFLNSLDAITRRKTTPDQPEDILADIDNLLKQLDEPTAETRETYNKLAESVRRMKAHFHEPISGTVNEILTVYKKGLEERLEEQRKAFDLLQRFLDSVNGFLEGKRLEINRLPEETVKPRATDEKERRFVARLENRSIVTPEDVLSSGERQIACLIYASTHLGRDSDNRVVLIDEPELSLHIDWQRKLLGEMQRQVGTQQIIVCTHSPDIGAEHEEAIQILDVRPILVPTRQETHLDSEGRIYLDEMNSGLDDPN